MIIMSVDFGDARTGIAKCDKSEFLASPVTVIYEKNFNTCAQKVANLAKKENAEMIVVGLPKNMDGSLGSRAQICTKFGELVKKLSGIEVIMWDERSTTVLSYTYLNQTKTFGKKRKAEVDAVAATLILESYLGYRKNKKEEL